MKKFYVTTAIDYPNGAPHLGHALEKVQADVLARYYRSKLGEKKVHFVTGTDEHGVKIARTAEQEKITPEQLVERNVPKFLELLKALNVSNDDFVRTSEPRHEKAATALWKALEAAGTLEKRSYGGWYCVGCEAFKTDREITDKRCMLHPTRDLEWVEEENWFFKLSDFKSKLKKHFEAHPDFVQPEHRKREVLNVIEELEDVSFSRPRASLDWGVPVPGDPDQVMYVWCDALTNYISAIGYPDELKMGEWWGGETQVTHVIGKDILRFHAAIWPAMLMVAGLPLPNTIFVHGFIHTKEGHLSKSSGNIVDPMELVEKYGSDAVRYFLLREIPTSDDGDFSIERFEQVYNADLANNLGNLVTRVYSMINRYLDGKIPSGFESDYAPVELGKEFSNFRLSTALAQILYRFGTLNAYLEQNAPWKLEKGSNKQAEILWNAHDNLQYYAKQLAIFLPETAEKIKQFVDGDKVVLQPPLFPRLEKK
jgi:methionyl-tRNA synthetase